MSNRELALTFLQRCFDGDMEAAMALMADDATWWVLGNPDRIKLSGTRNMTRVRRFLRAIVASSP